MLERRSIRLPLAFFFLSCALLTSGLPLGAVPTAPTNLSATVNGQIVTLTWTASTNSPATYLLQAGFGPGHTAVSVGISAAETTFVASAGPGTYFARLFAIGTDGSTSPV